VGDTEIVKLVDFGIAKLVGDIEGIQDITLDGRIIGTPSYMSPERLNNQSYDGKADVYSVGVMLYQMLSGRLPFQSSEKKSEPLTIAMMHLTKPPKPLRELNPKLSEEIEAIVMKALAKSPADRPTAKELGEEFVKAVGSLPQTSSESGFASDTDEQGVRTDTQTLVRPFYFDEEF
jgi:serine/threonine protein kinase